MMMPIEVHKTANLLILCRLHCPQIAAVPRVILWLLEGKCIDRHSTTL